MVDGTTASAGGVGNGGDENARPAGIVRRVVNWLHDVLQRFQTGLLITIFFVLIGMIALAPQIFITIPSGHVGVMWYRFFGGTVVEHTYGEGVQLIFPWDEMFIYDARLQNQARVYDTISSNGLSMEVDIAVRYRINREAAGMLHKLVGPNYPEVLVYPEIGSHARELISRYTPEQLYTETRAFIQAEILERMVNQLGSSLVNQSFQGRLVTVEDVLIRSVKLPERVADAIERKAEQYQAMLEYDFRLAREEKEKQRKKIEAEGIREFQDIVAKTITEEYLRLRGIEATMSLATSKNSKTIIIGGRDGLPVILNTADAPGSSRESEESGAELTGDQENTLPSASDFNARGGEISPQNAISPGLREPGSGRGSSAAIPEPAMKPNASQPASASQMAPSGSAPEQPAAPGTMQKVMQSIAPIYDASSSAAGAPAGREPAAQPEMKADIKQ
ncbi:prohibitin family protein [Thalassospira sp.]|uniref:prohibitin family protein n=1 Tax=Thalassospira sp. TaxID=1912094 RepID=UPI0032EB1CBC